MTASGFFDTGDLRHELKFGFGYRQIRERFADDLARKPAGRRTSRSILRLAAITRPANDKACRTTTTTPIVGDTVQVGNLTVNVGARFDYQQGKNLPSAVPANPVFPELLPAVQFAGDAGYPITWRQVEPRVGATYALGSDRKTLLRASYSRFANRLGTETGFVSAFPGPAALLYDWNDANGNHLVEPNEIDFSTFPSSLSASTRTIRLLPSPSTRSRRRPSLSRPTSSSSERSGRSCRISRRRSRTRTVPRAASRSLRSSAPAAAAITTSATPREASRQPTASS